MLCLQINEICWKLSAVEQNIGHPKFSSDSGIHLQLKVMVLTLSSGLVLPFLEGWVSSSFIIADSRCFLGPIGSIHYLLIASQLHYFQDD